MHSENQWVIDWLHGPEFDKLFRRVFYKVMKAKGVKVIVMEDGKEVPIDEYFKDVRQQKGGFEDNGN